MTAVIYARYSCDSQREESIEGQIRDCIAYAERQGIKILETYIDRALSAKTDNRPQFQKMIKDSAQKLFDVILVWKLDRFARNRYDSAHYKNILKKNNVKVMSATESISQGAEGILLESLLEGMAEYYSAELAEKVTRGLHENALKSKFNGGTLTIGYKIDENRRYAINPETAPFVLECYKMYLEGMTIKQLVKAMNEKGMRNTWGTEMTITTMTNLLKNRRYLGEYRYGDIVNKGEIPQIIPDKLFNAVQKAIAKNRRAPARHKATDDYLLTTKLVCGNCGSALVGEIGTSQNGSKYRYYRCISAKRKRGCDKKKGHTKDVLETLVLQQIMKIIMDDETIDKIADLALEQQSKENITLPALRKQLSDINKSIDNVLNAIQNGIYTTSTKERLTKLEKSKEEVELLIAKEEIEKPFLSKEEIVQWFYELRKFNIDTLMARKCLINAFVNSIAVYDEKLQIVFNYRDGIETIPYNLHTSSVLKSFCPPFRVFITDSSDEHSIFIRFFIVFSLCIEQVLACSFLLCCEIFNSHTLPHIQFEVFLI